MQQLLLNLDTGNAPSLDTYLTGQNGEVVHLLREIAYRTSREHFVYLWGDNATGKTHLLKALSQFSPARYKPISVIPHNVICICWTIANASIPKNRLPLSIFSIRSVKTTVT